MAKVALRVYDHEIENMIEGGQLDEAVAHCQHILKTFSMHIETYRLFGKTFLEGRRYTDAADIFQRVLMAVPDDFVAHVGMSIIHDDAGKLDDAIWHMERAFEVQPSNPAIQGELRRLYGRRDGVEPPKIRLSRDALANMYSQGELFNQAIAEIRSVLADDPNRPDLQVMLGRAYLQAGKKVEAAEMAANLLKKYQYCMDALRILVDVLPGTARADNTQVYRQRLCLLDPYSAFTTGSAFGSDQVADAAVNIERLEYKPGGVPEAVDPNWATSLGIKLDAGKQIDEKPDWLTGRQEAEMPVNELPENPGTESPEPSPVPADGDESIPEWMRSSGWQETTGTTADVPADSGMEAGAVDGPIAQADIPDWLKSMAPPEMTAPETAEPDQPGSESGDVPDWLANLGTSAPAGAVSGFTADGFDQPAVSEPPLPEPPISKPVVPSPVIQEPALGQSEPDSVLESQQNDASFQPTGEAKPLGIEDDTFSWLESLAAKQGAKPEELLTNAEERSGEIPDWLRGDETKAGSSEGEFSGTTAETHASIPPVELPPAPVEETQAPVTGDEPAFQPSGEVKPLGIEDDTFSWLEGLAAKQGANPEELLTNATERSEIPPEWVPTIPLVDKPSPEPDLFEDRLPPVELGETLEKSVEGLATPEMDIFAEEQSSGQKDDQSLASWLSRLDETPGANDKAPDAALPPKVFEQSLAGAGELPDWLKDLEKPAPGTDSQPKVEQPGDAMPGLPDWLQDSSSSDTKAPAVAPPPPAVDHEMPTWIGGERPSSVPPVSGPEPEMPAWIDEQAPVANSAAPTDPEEWLPVEQKPLAEPNPDKTEKTTHKPSVDNPPAMHSTGMLARIPDEDKDGDQLARAQTCLDENHLNEAMKEYIQLIKKGRLLEEVIHDLREAIYRFPVDVIIWQTLGDACMRANRLQDALDAYTKAEELLR